MKLKFYKEWEKDEFYNFIAIRKRKRTWLAHILSRDCLQRRIMEGKIEEKKGRGFYKRT